MTLLLCVPLAIYVMRSVKPIPIVLLFGLAFGISIGSVMTPIGNPHYLTLKRIVKHIAL